MCCRQMELLAVSEQEQHVIDAVAGIGGGLWDIAEQLGKAQTYHALGISREESQLFVTALKDIGIPNELRQPTPPVHALDRMSWDYKSEAKTGINGEVATPYTIGIYTSKERGIVWLFGMDDDQFHIKGRRNAGGAKNVVTDLLINRKMRTMNIRNYDLQGLILGAKSLRVSLDLDRPEMAPIRALANGMWVNFGTIKKTIDELRENDSYSTEFVAHATMALIRSLYRCGKSPLVFREALQMNIEPIREPSKNKVIINSHPYILPLPNLRGLLPLSIRIKIGRPESNKIIVRLSDMSSSPVFNRGIQIVIEDSGVHVTSMLPEWGFHKQIMPTRLFPGVYDLTASRLRALACVLPTAEPVVLDGEGLAQ